SIIHLNRQRTLREQRDARVALELQQARLAALGSQLQPHFLFNTLNSVSALIEERQNERAFEMVARISELLRLSLAGGVSAEIPLETELQFVERYVHIERLRFEDRLLFACDIGADPRAARVPSLILQPLVENCVRHGVERSTAQVEIKIAALAEGAMLTLTVSDTGPGLPAEWSGAASYGIGLRNVTERLRTLYGSRGALELRRREPQGVVATITLPMSPATPEAGG
ncbi:MAG TPA: sensor histidine kinase, partial [candidate division Zixibacteria bacterium]|nr:sensor histidine kinase [candidate division Zixibacteria bacterium]